MGSSRLFGKVLLPGPKYPLLVHLIKRISKSKFINEIVIATSNMPADAAIINICKNYKLNFFIGSENDVLSRYYFCAKKYKADFVVRITSDCPLVDKDMINKVIKKGLITNADYTSNIHPLTVADGFDVEFIKFVALKKAFLDAKKKYLREHVTPYLWDNVDKFKIESCDCEIKSYPNFKNLRLTLDYIEDYLTIYDIFERFKNKKYFSAKQIVNLLLKDKTIIKNKKFTKVNWYRKHLKDLKTIKKSDTNLNIK